METKTFYWASTYVYINIKNDKTYASFDINDVYVKLGYRNKINIKLHIIAI